MKYLVLRGNSTRKYKFILTIFSIVLLGCNKDRELKKKYYKNGIIKEEFETNKENQIHGSYKEYYDSGQLKLKTNYFNDTIADTVKIFYRNGILKEKGLSKGDYKLKEGWWFYYDSIGKMTKKEQYKVFDDNTIYKNQTILYTHDKVDEEKSSYFFIDLPDTVKLGKSIGRITKYSSNYLADKHLIYVVVNNKYSDFETRKDTFSDGTLKPIFGINTYKEGSQKIDGFIVEEIINLISKDTLDYKTHKKYFVKSVYAQKD